MSILNEAKNLMFQWSPANCQADKNRFFRGNSLKITFSIQSVFKGKTLVVIVRSKEVSGRFCSSTFEDSGSERRDSMTLSQDSRINSTAHTGITSPENTGADNSEILFIYFP